jgi:hypothetical protein
VVESKAKLHPSPRRRFEPDSPRPLPTRLSASTCGAVCRSTCPLRRGICGALGWNCAHELISTTAATSLAAGAVQPVPPFWTALRPSAPRSTHSVRPGRQASSNHFPRKSQSVAAQSHSEASSSSAPALGPRSTLWMLWGSTGGSPARSRVAHLHYSRAGTTQSSGIDS